VQAAILWFAGRKFVLFCWILLQCRRLRERVAGGVSAAAWCVVVAVVAWLLWQMLSYGDGRLRSRFGRRASKEL
jgi:hypothetical protein